MQLTIERHRKDRPYRTRGSVRLPVAADTDTGPQPIPKFPTGELQRKERLGGLLKHDHRVAA